MNTKLRNIFALEDVQRYQQNLEWPFLSSTSLTQFGYFAGGSDPDGTDPNSIVDRIDFSNDTVMASPRNFLTIPRRNTAAIGNDSYGWFSGGANPHWTPPFTPGPLQVHTLIDRIDYSNDTNFITSRSLLLNNRRDHMAVGSLYNGYFVAGKEDNTPRSSTEKFNFENDLIRPVYRFGLDTNRYGGGATSDSNYGYIAGGSQGSSPSAYSSIETIDFSNDLTGYSRSSLAISRTHMTGVGNNNYAWFGGGLEWATPAPAPVPIPFIHSSIERLDYANGTSVASPRGPLSVGKYNISATGNLNYGYFSPGNVNQYPYNPSPPYLLDDGVDRIDYSNDTVTTSVRGGLSFARVGTSAISGGSLKGRNRASSTISASSGAATNFGYFSGGNSEVSRIDFSNDTKLLQVTSYNSLARSGLSNTANSNYIWFVGGYNPAGSPQSSTTIDRLDYANDAVVASSRGLLSLGRYELRGVGNENFGWVAGGYSNAISPNTSVSLVDKIDYSNDLAWASVRGPLTRRAYNFAASCNLSYGWCMGGFEHNPNTNLSSVDRIDYSNDTATASPRGTLNFPLYSFSGTGTGNFGYAFGGYHNTSYPGRSHSYTQRIDYSNDTALLNFRGALSRNRNDNASLGNNSYGYTAGSGTDIDRIDYSNDLTTASLRASMNESRGSFTGASAAANGLVPSPTPPAPPSQAVTNFAYLGGGNPTYTEIERLDFSNDLIFARNYSPGRFYLGSTSSSTNGYFSGGTPGFRSNIERIDFSNDAAALSTRAPLTMERYGLAGTGNNTDGWYAGGIQPAGPSTVTRIDRIQYANDTLGTFVRGALNTATTYLAATGNQNYGWYAGGNGGGSRVQRIDYANDNVTAPSRGNLYRDTSFLAATGNANYGYFAGGAAAPETPLYTTIHRVDYSNDTVTAVERGGLNYARNTLFAIGNAQYGYFAGGYQPAPAVTYSYVEKMDFSNDTNLVSVRSNMIRERSKGAGVSAASSGLITASPAPAPLPTAASNYSYAAGGTGGNTSISRLDHTNDFATGTSLGNVLTIGRYDLGSTSSPAYAYFAGGISPTPAVISSIDRLDYSTDTTLSLARGPLSIARYNLNGVGNASYGWFINGQTPAAVTTVDRLDYSSDTTAASVRGSMSDTRYATAAAGTQDFGWIGGNGTSVDRIDYNNDTVITSVRTKFPENQTWLGAASNADYGWWASGGDPQSTYSTRVTRIDFSNDLSTHMVRGPLTLGGQYIEGAGDANYGWYIGGDNHSNNVDRVDFSNDTSIAPGRGAIGITRTRHTVASASSNNQA